MHDVLHSGRAGPSQCHSLRQVGDKSMPSEIALPSQTPVAFANLPTPQSVQPAAVHVEHVAPYLVHDAHTRSDVVVHSETWYCPVTHDVHPAACAKYKRPIISGRVQHTATERARAQGE
jgi:hypothetical protein